MINKTFDPNQLTLDLQDEFTASVYELDAMQNTMNSTFTLGSGLYATSSPTTGGVYTTITTGATTGTTGILGTNWLDLTINSGQQSSQSLQVKGDAIISGNLTVGGIPLTERFAKIEERLAILHQNAELEARWEKLRELGRQYREMEAEIIEQQKVWDSLKS